MRSPFFLRVGLVVLAFAATSVTAVRAEDLYRSGSWPALASDRLAQKVGDTLTVVIYESATASNTAQSGSRRNHAVSGEASAGGSTKRGRVNLGGTYDGAGQTGRSGKLLAQISVTVDAVLPNGDLHVSGAQQINVGGEQSFIRLAGRVRRVDLSSDNVVVSSRLADAAIDYDGSGFVSRQGAPGRVARIFNWMGLL